MVVLNVVVFIEKRALGLHVELMETLIMLEVVFLYPKWGFENVGEVIV